MTQAPISVMRPVSSATGMNASGRHRAERRVLPAEQGLEPGEVLQLDHRLVAERQLAPVRPSSRSSSRRRSARYASRRRRARQRDVLHLVHRVVCVAEHGLGADRSPRPIWSATPMLVAVGTVLVAQPEQRAANPRRTRSAISMACSASRTPWMTMTNSSPPTRPTRSSSRRLARSRQAPRRAAGRPCCDRACR